MADMTPPRKDNPLLRHLGGPLFGLLPDELLLKILLLLPLQDVALALSRVGDRRIAHLCLDTPKVWEHVKISDDDVLDTRSAVKVIVMAGAKMRYMSLSCGDFGGRRLGVGESKILAVTAMLTCSRLYSVAFDRVLFSGDLMKTIGESRTIRCVTATSKCVVTTGPPPPPLKSAEFVPHVTSFKNLTWLDITYLRLDSTNADWVKSLADTCRHLNGLRLPFTTTGMRDEVLNHLLTKLGSKLRTLSFYGPMLTDASICNLKHCLQLKRLSLHNLAKVGRTGLEAVAELSAIEGLCITRANNNISGKDFAAAFAGKKMTKLTYLNLYKCESVNDVSLAAIAESCPNLKELRLVGCKSVREWGVACVNRGCKKISRLVL